MINIFTRTAGAASTSELLAGGALPEDSVWIDLLNPTGEEERALERALGVEMPTHEEMREIEVSSRLYQEGAGTYMTATVLAKSDTLQPESTVVTFILVGEILVTLRYGEPAPFRTFAARCLRQSMLRASGEAVLMGLLDAVTDRLADLLERVGLDIDAISSEVFDPAPGVSHGGDFFKDMLRRVGRNGDLASKCRESLVSINRLLTFIGSIADLPARKDIESRMPTVMADVHSLSDHSTFLSGKVNFLLDATLGMVNIEQTNIIKLFSVAAVVFLPPTLIASIYGMNFEHMPELAWHLGYPLALVLMVASAIAPYWYFKYRRWL
ncbi:MAG TPA: magnesium transporter CorA family protein [Alphaproteobacteria bacterium]